MSINDNFSRNRTKFRKAYAYGGSRRPDVRTFIDVLTDTTKSFDFQKVIRDRDYFLISGEVTLETVYGPSQYWEGTYSLSTDSEYIDVLFPGVFDATPFVAFTAYPEGTLSGSNVGYWATDVSTVGFRANFSAPFSGSILYRAVYNPGSYPIYVERTPGNFAWVAASSSLYTGETSVTMSFATLPSIPESVLANPIGTSSDPLLAIGQTYSDVGTAFITSEFSSPYVGLMDFIAISTVPTGSPQPVDPP